MAPALRIANIVINNLSLFSKEKATTLFLTEYINANLKVSHFYSKR